LIADIKRKFLRKLLPTQKNHAQLKGEKNHVPENAPPPVKVYWSFPWLHLVSPQHFDHCDDAYLLSTRVQTTLPNHI